MYTKDLYEGVVVWGTFQKGMTKMSDLNLLRLYHCKIGLFSIVFATVFAFFSPSTCIGNFYCCVKSAGQYDLC